MSLRLLQDIQRNHSEGLGVGEGVVVVPEIITAGGGNRLKLMVRDISLPNY